MVVNFDILFDNGSGVYYAGQLLSGKVVIHLNKPKKMRGIELRIKAVAKVQWTENNGSDNTSSYYKGREDYISTTTHLLSTRDSTTLDAGTHTFHFACQLSPRCPSSFENRYGHIRYTARIVLVRPLKFDQEFTKCFTVLALVNLNQIPNLRFPLHAEVLRTFWCWPCSMGDLNIKLDMPQSGYVPGECLPLKITVDNKSNVSVAFINMKLRMFVKFRSQTPTKNTRKDSKTIARLYVEGVGSKTEKVLNYEIGIPATPPTSFELCGIIEITYKFFVEIYISGCNSKAILCAPVIIGTVPLGSCIQQQPTTSRAVERETYFGNEGRPEPLKIVRSNEIVQDDNPTPWGDSSPPTYEEAIHIIAGKMLEENINDYGPSEFSPRYPVFNIPRNTFDLS